MDDRTDFWADLDGEIVGCLERHGALSPGEVARHVGIPEGAATSLLCLLVQEGRVTIRMVELAADRERRVA
jgi:hypothetical protein